MPRPRGFEPYSNFWALTFSVYSSDQGENAPNRFLQLPRFNLYLDEGSAQSFADEVNNTPRQYPPPAGGFVPGSAQVTPQRFFNRKLYVQQFVAGWVDTVEISL